MIDNRSENVINICDRFSNADDGCNSCPLQMPCRTQVGDTKEKFDVRMNQAAEELEKANG